VKLNQANKQYVVYARNVLNKKKVRITHSSPTQTFAQTAEVLTRDRNNINRKMESGPANNLHTKLLAGGVADTPTTCIPRFHGG
jgi:hypothetical protein